MRICKMGIGGILYRDEEGGEGGAVGKNIAPYVCALACWFALSDRFVAAAAAAKECHRNQRGDGIPSSAAIISTRSSTYRLLAF